VQLKNFFIAAALTAGSVANAADNRAVVEFGVSTSRSPWFVDEDRSQQKSTSLPGLTVAAAYSVPLSSGDAIAFDLQTERYQEKAAMVAAEEFGATKVDLISARYEKHFEGALIAPFIGFGKTNEKDSGGIGHMFGLQALTQLKESKVNFFGTVGHADFVTDIETSGANFKKPDGAFIGTFTEFGALATVSNEFSLKATVGCRHDDGYSKALRIDPTRSPEQRIFGNTDTRWSKAKTLPCSISPPSKRTATT
jgi:hypothetical protein